MTQGMAQVSRTTGKLGHAGSLALLLAILAAALVPGGARAAEPVKLTLKDHKFDPDHVTVPAGERFRIELTNHDDTTNEFESSDMKIEKLVVPGATITVSAGPLRPGTYKFFDDYHPETAFGVLTAVEKKD